MSGLHGGIVYFKFKSAKKYDMVTFDAPFIQLFDLKVKIVEMKSLAGGMDFQLAVTNAQTKVRGLSDARRVCVVLFFSLSFHVLRGLLALPPFHRRRCCCRCCYCTPCALACPPLLWNNAPCVPLPNNHTASQCAAPPPGNGVQLGEIMGLWIYLIEEEDRHPFYCILGGVCTTEGKWQQFFLSKKNL